jgi:nucleoid-associated protein YgaU
MELHGKYKYAVETAKNFNFAGTMDEHDGKLYFKGTVPTQDQANKIWDAIKTIPTWPQEVVADIQASSTTATNDAIPRYTVKAGDTLSSIAKELLGDAQAYTDIFNANRDQLSDVNKIRPGQVLKIPQHQVP